MESCGGSNYWARVFKRSGHTVKLISPQFVKPFVKTNKNDANDAQVIVEAASGSSISRRLRLNLKYSQTAELIIAGRQLKSLYLMI
jgi:transposase